MDSIAYWSVCWFLKGEHDNGKVQKRQGSFFHQFSHRQGEGQRLIFQERQYSSHRLKTRFFQG